MTAPISFYKQFQQMARRHPSLCAVSLTGVVAVAYLGILKPVTTRFEAAQMQVEQSRQLYLDVMAESASLRSSRTASNAQSMHDALVQGPSTPIKLSHSSRSSKGRHSTLIGPVESLENWLATFEKQGAYITELELVLKANGQLAALISWE
ncbi:hypothetical protein PS865_04452 [Pseudomonas fluorescens]|uniref:type II secretion system protein GspM n=1 Tax=Pseudomonas fluorescens TaxID=294 RepID=UPI0012420BC4|nr:type II secretion system protein GspM [Pseudomonas fluorescens]VVP32833.1 hypothetical protein PS865_04452 [Pseudomonas fluorescens]